jgi:hypothetical protein
MRAILEGSLELTRISISQPMLRLLIITVASLVLSGTNISSVSAQGLSVAYTGTQSLVNPGDTVDGTIRVTNTSDEPKTLRIYQGDWVRIAGQTSGYQFEVEKGLEPRSSVDWMSVSPDQIILQPQEVREVKCEIKCPDRTDLKGTYWSVVFVEVVPPSGPENKPGVKSGVAGNIATVFRYAIQFFVTFKGTEVLGASFNSMTFSQEEKGFKVNAVFDNKGNVVMKPKVWLEVRDDESNLVYTRDYSAFAPTVLPESSRLYIFDLTKTDLPFQNGVYLFTILADYGGADLVAAQGSVELKADESEPLNKPE